MFMSESYFNLAREQETDINGDITWEALSIYPKVPLDADNSLFGKDGSSYDSGHDSYLEDGTGYSGDDEDGRKCDICSCTSGCKTYSRVTEEGSTMVLKKKRRRRRKRFERKSTPEHSNKKRDFGETKFDFEGSASNEKQWTMEYYFDEENLVHRLKRVIIARKGNDDDFENMVVLETASGFAMSSFWRCDILHQVKARNKRESASFGLLPTTASCDACVVKRVEKIKNAVLEGTGFHQNGKDEPDDCDTKNTTKNASSRNWRKKILYDLKLGNCQVISYINSQRHSKSTSTKKGEVLPSSTEVNGGFAIANEWAAYEIISDDNTVL